MQKPGRKRGKATRGGKRPKKVAKTRHEAGDEARPDTSEADMQLDGEDDMDAEELDPSKLTREQRKMQQYIVRFQRMEERQRKSGAPGALPTMGGPPPSPSPVAATAATAPASSIAAETPSVRKRPRPPLRSDPQDNLAAPTLSPVSEPQPECAPDRPVARVPLRSLHLRSYGPMYLGHKKWLLATWHEEQRTKVEGKDAKVSLPINKRLAAFAVAAGIVKAEPSKADGVKSEAAKSEATATAKADSDEGQGAAASSRWGPSGSKANAKR
jgi:hypothetical protein